MKNIIKILISPFYLIYLILSKTLVGNMIVFFMSILTPILVLNYYFDLNNEKGESLGFICILVSFLFLPLTLNIILKINDIFEKLFLKVYTKEYKKQLKQYEEIIEKNYNKPKF